MAMLSNNPYDFDSYVLYMERAIDIWARPVSVYETQNRSIVGYEDNLGHNPMSTDPDVEGAEQEYKSKTIDCFLNFNPSRSVFYKYNYFPENSEELVLGFFRSADSVKDLTYVRTSTLESVSPWGDMIFKVEKVVDLGKYRTLKRMWFLRPVSSQVLNDILTPAPAASSVSHQEVTE